MQKRGEQAEALKERSLRNKRAGPWSQTENTNSTALHQGSHQTFVAASLPACVCTDMGVMFFVLFLFFMTFTYFRAHRLDLHDLFLELNIQGSEAV